MERIMQQERWLALREKILKERIFTQLQQLGYVLDQDIDVNITIPDTNWEEPVLAVALTQGTPRIACDLLWNVPATTPFETAAFTRASIIYEVASCYDGKAPSHAWITDGQADLYFDYQKHQPVNLLPKATDIIYELEQKRQEELLQEARLRRQKEAFYQTLQRLREEFHSTGRFDDANAKLDELAKLLVMKVHEEKRRLAEKDYRFDVPYLSQIAQRHWNDSGKIALALHWLFEKLITDSAYRNADGTSIFGSKGSLNIQPTDDSSARLIVEQLNNLEILHFASEEQGKMRELHFDILNEAFGHFMRDSFRDNKEDAQYMTPSEAVNAMVDLAFCDIEDDPDDRIRILEATEAHPYRILDPTCGTGTFLVAALRRTYRFIDDYLYDEGSRRRLKTILKDCCVRGQDKIDRMVRLAKMNMIMFGDGSSNITQGNSILPELTPGEQLKNLIGAVDLIVTNPPFGAEFIVAELIPDLNAPRYPLIYDYFLRAHYETFQAAEQELQKHQEQADEPSMAMQEGVSSLKTISWEKQRLLLSQKVIRARKRIEEIKRNKVNSEIILIDHYFQLLRPGGRLVMVVPDSVLFNTGIEAFLRTWVRTRAVLRAVISFPPVTFAQAGTQAKTSALYLQKQTLGNTLSQEKVFMAICSDIGFDVKTNGSQKVKIMTSRDQILKIVAAYAETRSQR